jgi:hypothetical protein
MPNYHAITLYQQPVVVHDLSQQNITVRQTDVVSANIILWPMVPYPTRPLVTIILRPTPDPAEVFGGVYPPVVDVDSLATRYGPNGNDYQGTLLQPVPANVKQGVQYGGDGIEFTGTLAPGIFPDPYDVDITAPAYGPTGSDHGTLVQPAIADVKIGVQYGGDGTEFTGTLSGGGLAHGTILYDIATGDLCMYINGKLIMNLS